MVTISYRALIAGGGAPEIQVSQKLMDYAKTLKGMEQYCFQAFAEALEIIPTTLAENAGLNPIKIVTELRNRHARGEITAGINVKKGTITNILEENVIQPLLVSTSAMELAAETVKMILKIDDLVSWMIVCYITCMLTLLSRFKADKQHIPRIVITIKTLSLNREPCIEPSWHNLLNIFYK